MSMKDFQVLSKLGEGAFSVVFKVRRISDGLEYALKKVRLGGLSTKERENALNEVRILASILHPNIISYKEAFIEESSSSLCIVMEYAEKGDLLGKIDCHVRSKTQFSEAELWALLVQMVCGLKALHDKKILHRDIKCANIFITKDDRIKLGDLNVSKVSKGGMLYTQTGTPYYASPEIWKDKPYDLKSDMWSLGCVLYEAAAQHPPFRAPDMQGLYRKVVAGSYPDIPRVYSPELGEVIKQLLQLNPGSRPTCSILMNAKYDRTTPGHAGGDEEVQGAQHRYVCRRGAGKRGNPWDDHAPQEPELSLQPSSQTKLQASGPSATL